MLVKQAEAKGLYLVAALDEARRVVDLEPVAHGEG
jgi:hypothetical protein